MSSDADNGTNADAGGAAPVQPWAPKEPPALPGFPPDQPISREPVEGVSLEGYAQIAAVLAEGKHERNAVLAEHQLDETRWLVVEREWALRIAAAALRGDLSLAERYDHAYIAAQSAQGPEQPTHTLADYAVISAELELAVDTAPVVLARRGLTVADFARLSRFWNERLGQDPTSSKAFRAQVNEHKAGLSVGPNTSSRGA